MKETVRTFKLPLLVGCLILSGFGVQAFGQDRPINSRIFPPYRFGDQRSVSNQQRIRAQMVTMINSFINQDSSYEFFKYRTLGDPALLYGYFPAPSDPPGEYEIFIMDGISQRHYNNQPQTVMDASQFCDDGNGVTTGWFIENNTNGPIVAANDFVIVRGNFLNNDTWWHEAQHAAFVRGGGVHVAPVGRDHPEHSYITHYANAAIVAMNNLRIMEENIERINITPPKGEAEENIAWGKIYQFWRIYIRAWETNVHRLSNGEMNEYYRLAGVLFPTPEELAKVYLQGNYKHKLGIKPPAWVFSLMGDEPTYIWTEVPLDQGKAQETSYLHFDIRSANGRTRRSGRPGTGTITVVLEEASPKATFAIEVEDGGKYSAIGQRTTSNGKEWSFDLAKDNSSVGSKYFRLALTVAKNETNTATDMHAKISYSGFTAPPAGPGANFAPCTLKCAVPVMMSKASLKVSGHVLIKRSDTAELTAYVVDANGKRIGIDPKLSPRFIWSFFKKDDHKGNPVLFSPRTVEDLTIGVKILITQDGIEKPFLEGSHPMKVVSDTAPPDPKKPGEKPTAEKPPAKIIPAMTSQPGETGFADAGALQAGAWLLQGQSDQIQKKSDDVDGRGAKLNVYTLTVSGQTIESGTQWYGSARPRSMRSTLSLPNFPARVVMDQPTDLRIQLSRKTDGIFDDAIVTIFRQEGSPNLMMRLSGADIQTNNYNGLAFDLFSSFMYRVPTAGEIQSVKVKFVGPGGQFMRTYSYAWQPGVAKASAAPPSAAITPLAVNIASDKPTVVPGETALLKATTTGGTPPFTYSWTGPVKGAADKLSFIADKPGKQDFTVTVSDSKGSTATASASVTIEAPTVTIRRTTTGPVVLGLPYGFQAQLSAAGKPLPGTFVYRWEPHPAVTYSPHEGASTQTTAVFTRPGSTLVWVDVLRQEGPVLVTVAESEQIEIDVVSPELSLAANPSAPFTGQEVRINVTMSPAIQDKYVTFWWEIQGNALNAGPVVVGDAYSRAYTYKPKDTAPVTVTVHSKSKDGGDDLGQKSIAVTAKLYQVKISEPRLMGPPPRVWSEQAKQLVEVPRGIGTFQEFFVNASISPAPPDSPLRYDWKSQPEGCSIYSPGSQETRSSASQAGSFNISVTIRDSQNIVLGSGERTVSIVAPAPEPNKAEPVGRQEALDLLKQAQSLYQQDKLNEALKMAEEAVNSDPANSDASRFAEELREELQQIKQTLKTVEDLAVNGKLDEAVVELEKVKKPHPGYEGVRQFESTLQDLKKNEAERTKKAEEEEEEVKAVEADTSEADAGREKAADLFNQAQSLYQQDNLLEALEIADAAANSDPANPEADRFAKDLRVELEQIIQSLKSIKDLVNQGLLSEASAELEKLVKPHPLFAKFAEYERWLQGLTKAAEEKKRVEDEEAPAAEAVTSEADAGREKAADLLKQSGVLFEQNKIAEALALAEEALGLDPKNQDASRYVQTCRDILLADQKLKQARDLNLQSRTDEALALSEEALRLDPDSKLAVTYIRLLQASKHNKQAVSLAKAGRLEEAAAEIAEAKKLSPSEANILQNEQWIQGLIKQRDANKAIAETKKAETARQQAATQAATEHLDQALSLGKAGSLDEAAAEVAEAKNDDPGHSRIPEFEQWIRQLRQQRETAARAAEQKSAEDMAAKARAREAAAQSAAEEKKRREPPPEPQGCSLSGEWVFSEEGGTMTLSLRQTGTSLAGTITINDPSIGSSSLAVSGSMSGRDVRITGAKADFEISFSGTVAADCQTLNISSMMEGETHATPFRRR